MQKVLDLALLLIKQYKEPATTLATMIYDLSEVKLLLENDLSFVENTDLPYLIIINKICSTYIKDEMV